MGYRVIKKICELGEVVGGATPLTKVSSYWGGDISWISPKDLAGYGKRYISYGERNITQEGLDSCSAIMLPKGTILFSSRAPIGYTAIASQPLCTNQGFKSVVPNRDTDSLFLYYLLKSNAQQIASHGSGTTFKEISGKAMREIELSVPADKEEQKKIASILDSIDTKIELNNRINDYLSEISSALFEHALEESRTEVLLGDIVELEDAKRIPLNSRDRARHKGPYPYYGATAIMDYVDDYLFDGIRILLGEDGTVISDDGKPILQYVWGKYWVNNHAHILKASSSYSLETIYVALSRTAINHIVTGAVQMKISQRNLKSLRLTMPEPDTISDLSTLFEMYRQNVDENKELERLRNSLLPKLMSGEIDVSQVEIPTQLNNHLCDCLYVS